MLTSNFWHGQDLDNFILVHTMGKVGSTSLVRSLQAVDVFCRHLQWLSPETQAFHDKLSELLPGECDVEFEHALTRLNVLRARHALSDPAYAALIKVITVIRAPIELILSHCFHGIGIFASHAKQKGRELDAASLSEDLIQYARDYTSRRDRSLLQLQAELCEDNFCAVYFHWVVENYVNWFDREFTPFFATEIIGGRQRDGYQIAGNALILKFEELQGAGARAVALYSQRPQFKLLRENVGGDKSYGELYRKVASAIRFPADFVGHLCDAKYVRHFYSDDERRRMLERWT